MGEVIEDQRLNLASFRLLVHIVNQAALALDATVGNLADLLRIEGLPGLVIQVLIERHNEYGVDKIDEGVSNITAIVQVEGQVEKVIPTLMQSVNAI